MDDDPTYSVEQARALIPMIRGTLLQLAVERQRTDDAHDALYHRLAGDPPSGGAEKAQLESAMGAMRAGIRDLLDHLEALGIIVRDLDEGLVDIPTLRGGERAWLCWRLSDPELEYWHTTSEGFSARQPL